MSIGIRLAPRASESKIKAMVEAAGGVYEGPPKKKKRARPEDDLHLAVRKFLSYMIAPPGVASRYGVMWHSNEARNAGKPKQLANGKTINLEGIARKARGCVSGVPDITVIWLGHIYGIELKAPGGALSVDQKRYHGNMRHAGALVEVATSLDAVTLFLRQWGIPLTARVAA